ncbi:MAG TPA: phenylalanine--tRNA ligase subunit alpha [Dehalococcoidia bacterium]|nr:phenylalanine--tRNA ligase subunit alpha [Dehalococcoidia bacterium]
MAQIDLETLRQKALSELDAAGDAAALQAWRHAYLGRQGALTRVLRGLGELPADERRSVGAQANELKRELEERAAAREEDIERAAIAALESGAIDVTLPGRRGLVGRLHPITQTMRDILAALKEMGFQVAEGPEVEWEYYNFDALRIPEHHPARDSQDTFWLDFRKDGRRSMLLRTQTSPMQIRFMEQHKPPIRVASPGRVYRYEATDATHEWMITQVELLAVDEGLNFRHMKGCLTQLAQALFGRDRSVRFRCDFFPFVEPGAEVAIECGLCHGAGCRSCGNEGYLEIGGAGMVHREILENVGYDADRYTGFAAGFGVERIAMLRHGIDDIRYFYANDLRFLRQF